MSLPKVIDVIADKCQNCHACISVCPSKFCNDGSGNYVSINSDLCIGCGQCIDACTWNARVLIDDTQSFFRDLAQGEKIITIVAPAIASSFPDTYLNLNGWLKQIGISANFDVSFGAELTVKSYLEHAKNNEPKAIIAQPCPAIVSYIELYKPELLQYLAPAESPMLHIIKMIREYYPQYSNHKIAAISPCVAKKREFDETGLCDYNVTMSALIDYLESNRITLTNYPRTDYDNPPAERAVMFSSPGGLMETAIRWNPELRYQIRKIEGPQTIYEYLDKLEKDIHTQKAPLIIDCLNCEKGCNGGTGTKCRHESPDALEHYIKRRKNLMQKRYLSPEEREHVLNNQIDESEKDNVVQERIAQLLDKYWKPGLYERKYVNRSSHNLITNVPKRNFEEIYKIMLKETEEDHKNCSACGYGNCKDMAIAIHNGLNKPQNCHYYQSKLLKVNLEDRRKAVANFQELIVNEFNTEKLLSRFTPIIKAIEDISFQTQLLSMNASIEAVRAGDAGSGFDIVAKEVRNLASKSNQETAKIYNSLSELQSVLDKAVGDFEKQLELFLAEEKKYEGDTNKSSKKEVTT